jgi:hypothetical protein
LVPIVVVDDVVGPSNVVHLLRLIAASSFAEQNGQNWTIDQVVFVFNSSELAAASNSVKSKRNRTSAPSFSPLN